MTTKEQERKALEQIKKILAGLGEDSYVATAMEGMIEDAEENIQNDFALSRYDAWQSAEQKADKLEAMLVETADKLAEAQKKIEELEAKVLPIKENCKIQKYLREYRNGMAELKAKSEKTILEYCEDTKASEFKNAVDNRRLASDKMQDTEKLIEMLDAQIRPVVQ